MRTTPVPATAPLAGAIVAVLVTALGGCTDPGTALDDGSTCPGATCVEETSERFDSIAALDRVTRVETVAWDYHLDRGSSRSAEVSAAVATKAEAVDVALEVLGVLDPWPGRDGGDALASVTADPAVTRRQVEVGEQALDPAFYERCRPAACRTAVVDLEQALAAVDGVTDLSAGVDDDVLRLRVVAATPAGQVVTAVLDRVETDLAVRVADRVRVEVEHTGPLAVTVRLAGDRVCEQPPGSVVSCTADNSIQFATSLP